MIFQNIKTSLKKNELLFARLYYFAYLGGWGFASPFVNLYYTSLGFNGKQIGIIASTGAVIGLLAAPVVVSQIKKRPQARSLLQFIILIGALGYFMIGQQNAFLPVIAVVILQSLASTSIAPLSDSMAVSISQATNSGYGSLRVWGSLGWILIVPASGWLVERLGLKSVFTSVSLAWLCAAGLLFLISHQYFTTPFGQVTAQPGLRAAIRKIAQNRTLFGFAIAVAAIGLLNNGVLQFENVYLSDLGASKQLISIAGILSALVELPFMLLSDRFLRRIGPHRMLLIALLLTVAQRMMVLLWPSIAMIMLMRFIGGMAFSFYTISYVGLISTNTDPHETGTVLAIFTVTLAGSVSVVASPLAGALYDITGARWLYAFSAAGYAIAAVSLWLNRPQKASAVALQPSQG